MSRTLTDVHWHRFGDQVVLLRVTTCRSQMIDYACKQTGKIKTHAHVKFSADANRVTCLKCVALMPDYIAEIRLAVREGAA